MKTTHTKNLPEVAIDCRDKWHYTRMCANERENASVTRLSCRAVRELLAERDELLAFAELYIETWPAAGDDDSLAKAARAAIAKAKGGAL